MVLRQRDSCPYDRLLFFVDYFFLESLKIQVDEESRPKVSSQVKTPPNRAYREFHQMESRTLMMGVLTIGSPNHSEEICISLVLAGIATMYPAKLANNH